MSKTQGIKIILTAVGLLTATGCMNARNVSYSHSIESITDTSRRELVVAGENALVSLGYSIERSDATSGVITTVPILDASLGNDARTARRLSTKPRIRKIVELYVVEKKAYADLHCRVAVQQQTTQAHRSLAIDRSVDDTPTGTAIDRDAATTTSQNTLWETLRRDRAEERRILTAIRNAVK